MSRRRGEIAGNTSEEPFRAKQGQRQSPGKDRRDERDPRRDHIHRFFHFAVVRYHECCVRKVGNIAGGGVIAAVAGWVEAKSFKFHTGQHCRAKGVERASVPKVCAADISDEASLPRLSVQ